MSELDKLIQADGENVPNSRTILIQFAPELSRALDDASEMFLTFVRCMEGALDDTADLATLKECARELEVDEEKFVSLMWAEDQDPALDRARTAWSNYLARRARGIVYLLLQRQFMWGASDLLRMRITPALGYGRLEAESLALLFLMRDDPSIGKRWLRLATDSDGKQFYYDYQKKILEVLGRLNLIGAYEQGSGGSLHVRMMSAISGLKLGEKPNVVQLGYQELRQDNLFSYFLMVLYFLRTQDRVFQALGEAFPEVSDPIWPERVGLFTRNIDNLWGRLEKNFPKESEKLRRMA